MWMLEPRSVLQLCGLLGLVRCPCSRPADAALALARSSRCAGECGFMWDRGGGGGCGRLWWAKGSMSWLSRGAKRAHQRARSPDPLVGLRPGSEDREKCHEALERRQAAQAPQGSTTARTAPPPPPSLPFPQRVLGVNGSMAHFTLGRAGRLTAVWTLDPFCIIRTAVGSDSSSDFSIASEKMSASAAALPSSPLPSSP
jgi:hypothetical protein